VAFATTGNEEKKGNKKKEITCYKCGKSGHYSNECDKEDTVKASNTSNTGKKGSNFLVLKKDMDDSSSEDDDEAVSTFSDDEGPQMFDRNDDKGNNSNDDSDDDDTDDIDEANEESDDGKDNNDDDDYDECTDTDDEYEGFAFLQNDVMCSLQDKARIPMSWILLDSQSTVDVFSNKKMLTNTRDSKRTLTLYCNASKAIITQKGDLKGYGSFGTTHKGLRIFCLCATSKRSTRSHTTVLRIQNL